MKQNFNIAIIGLGQIGNYLFNELKIKKKDIEIKTGKKINVVAISAKNKNKKRKFKINKKIFFKNPIDIIKNKKIDILFEVIGSSDGISKKIVETALKNKIHVITPITSNKISIFLFLIISIGFLKKIFLLILNFLFLFLFFAEIATTFIFFPVLISISFFFILSSLKR